MGPSSGFLLVVISISIILTHAGPVPDTECPPDQEYKACGSACDSPCGKRDPKRLCTQQCITGCFCKPGFRFLEGSDKTKCVPCNPTSPVPVSKCPPDQIYYECGSPCSIMCAKSKPGQPCIEMCMTGCFCKPGFTFLEGSNKTKCVPCKPTSPVPDTKCPPDQEYNKCGSACDSPCGERDPNRLCTQQCVPGCFCKAGFTFLEGSNKTKCVPCNPPIPVPDNECPPDQIYYKCGSPCSMMCAKRDPRKPCIQVCRIGCFCKPGFMFLEGSNKTKCVPCK